MNKLRLTAAVAAAVMLAACSDDDDNSSSSDPQTTPEMASFEVQVVNLTTAQPLSPIAAIAHGNDYRAFTDGSEASVGLEVMAEAGMNSDLLAEAKANEAYLASTTASGPLAPSSFSDALTVSFAASELDDARLTVVTMLVNTNDAFTGVNAIDLGSMAVGQSRTLAGPAWDAGTEANTETLATIPGPVSGGEGEGFNSDRELRADNSAVPVRFHPGVVGNTGTEDGLPTSDLGEIHRFDNPVSRIIVRRVQ